MRTFWTSDLHFGHPNIIVYANRPFLKDGDLLEPHAGGKPKWASREIAIARADKMNQRLVNEINMRCKEDDVLIHVGDFCCYGAEKGVSGIKTKAQEWEDMLNPKVINVLGNHDKNNSVKGCIKGMMCKISHWNVWVQHYPPWSGKDAVPDNVDAYICGHVHNAWKFRKYNGKPVVNVGADAHNLRPVKQDELIRMIADIKSGRIECTQGI